MAIKQLVVYGSNTTPLVNADTTASPNSIPLRDSSGNVINVQTQSTTTRTTNSLIHPTPVTKTASFSAGVDTDFYVCDATSGAMVATLPAVAGCSGQVYRFIKKDNVNNVTVTGAGAELINGANTKVLSTQYGSVTIRSDGVQWWTC